MPYYATDLASLTQFNIETKYKFVINSANSGPSN